MRFFVIGSLSMLLFGCAIVRKGDDTPFDPVVVYVQGTEIQISVKRSGTGGGKVELNRQNGQLEIDWFALSLYKKAKDRDIAIAPTGEMSLNNKDAFFALMDERRKVVWVSEKRYIAPTIHSRWKDGHYYSFIETEIEFSDNLEEIGCIEINLILHGGDGEEEISKFLLNRRLIWHGSLIVL